jgi:predicted membrane chloride channel (bestrophin family)
MISINTFFSLLICLATAADLIMLSHLRRGPFSFSGILCSVLLSVGYLANIFAMHGNYYSQVASRFLCTRCGGRGF